MNKIVLGGLCLILPAYTANASTHVPTAPNSAAGAAQANRGVEPAPAPLRPPGLEKRRLTTALQAA